MNETITVKGEPPCPRPWYKKYLGFIVGIPAISACWWFGYVWWWWYIPLNPGVAILFIAGYWWFGNDEASAQGNSFSYRYVRNFAQNFRWHVAGCVDRDHTVKGPAPALANLWTETDPPRTGWKWAIVAGFLPYISYCAGKTEKGDGFVFYLGWQPRGCFGGRLTW